MFKFTKRSPHLSRLFGSNKSRKKLTLPLIFLLILSIFVPTFINQMRFASATSLGYTDTTYGGYGAGAVSLGNAPAVYLIPLLLPSNMTVNQLTVNNLHGAAGNFYPVIYNDSNGSPHSLVYNGNSSSQAWIQSVPNSVSISNFPLTGGQQYYFGIMISAGVWASGTNQSTSGTYDDWSSVTSYSTPPTTYSTDSVISGTMSLYINYTATSGNYPPTFSSNANFNKLLAGQSTTFSISVSDWASIQGYIFNSNITGTSTNSSYIGISGAPLSVTINSTLTMPSVGNSVAIGWFANATDGSWAQSNVFVFKSVNAYPVQSTLSLSTSGSSILNSTGQPFYYKEVGLFGVAPDNIFWNAQGNDNWGDQWQTGATLNASLNQEFYNLSTGWNVNAIRLWIYPEWWWQGNVTPSIVDPSSWGAYTTPINVRQYCQIVTQIAGNYGIYVDWCPYQLTAQTGAYDTDPYMSDGGGTPMTNTWDTNQTAFITSTGLTEQQFWSNFWGNFSSSLRDYPNAIFEAWNEPADQDTSPNVITPAYLSYLTTMYDAIRSTGSTNLIFMQYQEGWLPNGWGMNLSWASQITSALGGSPLNLAFTTHIYYYSPSDVTQYWDSNGLSNTAGGIPYNVTEMTTIFANLKTSMGVSAPLVFNEAGDCSYYSTNLTNDYIWWDAVNKAAYANDIGISAYYFARFITLGGIAGVNLGIIDTAPYSPNTFGQIFINDSVGNSLVLTNSSPSPSPSPPPSSPPTGSSSHGGVLPQTSPTSSPKPPIIPRLTFLGSGSTLILRLVIIVFVALITVSIVAFLLKKKR